MIKKNPFTKLLLFFCAFILPFAGKIKAQNQRILGLEEAISLGIAHSKVLKIDSINLKIADSKVLQAKNNQLPQVIANLSYIRISDNITPFQVRFPTGDVVLNPQILNQSYNNLQVRQLLWAGGKVRYANELLNLDKQSVVFDFQKNKSDITYTITNLWYNLFSTKQSQNIFKSNLNLLKSQLKDAENLSKQGFLLQNELLKIELGISNIESGLSDIENLQSLLKFNICTLTGLDSGNAIDIPETLPNEEIKEEEFNVYVAQALKNRAELKKLTIAREQTNIALKMTKSNIFPTLSAGGSINYDMPNQRLFPNEATLTGTWNIGLFLNWNLTDLYANKAKINESNLTNAKVNISLEQAKEGIEMEVNDNYNNYLQAKRKITIANKTVEQAAENFRVEQNKFQSMTTTVTEFLNANTLLVQSKINLNTAVANAALAQKKLLKSIN